MYKEAKNCRICGNDNLVLVMDIGEQALTGMFPKTRDESVLSGPVELVRCAGDDFCGLVQLRQSYDVELMYGDNYGYRSGLNQSMVDHLTNKVQDILAKDILRDGDLVVDIGSNDGTSLGVYPPGKYSLLGIDPSGEKFMDHYPPGVKLVPDFFSGKIVNDAAQGKKAKVITSFSMFYDLEDPIAFAREIEASLDDDGIWVCEQSYLPAMLMANSFDTICHEHLEFYSLRQIDWIAEKAGLKVIDVKFNDINGGSFSITAAKVDSAIQPDLAQLEKIRADELALGLNGSQIYEEFKQRVEEAKTSLMIFLNEALTNKKTVYGLGASTKGNVLLQYFNIDERLVKKIGEVNEDKFGKFTPGSLIPMISESELLALNPDYLLVLPWHFRPFFENLSSLKGRTLVYPLPKFEIVTQ
jgi:NDP-4-keto-2,6-dideoxyhexose 3-C-methyltransferase